MRISRAVRVALLATTGIVALSLLSSTEANRLGINNKRDAVTIDALMIDSSHATRVLATTPKDEDYKNDEAPGPPPSSASKKKRSMDDDEPTKAPKKKTTKEKEANAKKEKAAREAKEEEEDEKLIESVLKEAEEEEKKEKEKKAEAQKKKKKVSDNTSTSEKKTKTTDDTSAPEKKKKKSNKEVFQESEEKGSNKDTKKDTKGNDDDTVSNESNESNTVNETKIKGVAKEGVLDASSDGSAEIDKIDLRNNDGWVSVYDDPPLLVIKASLYAFISYNDTEVCDTFNMTMNAVEQKAEDNGRFSYHVVAYINCTKNNEDETRGRFILNFIPEGKRLLLTECGHREEGEIVNWLRIEDEVPECMTPKQRKEFLTQPMKHIHINNGSNSDVDAVQTDFLTRLEEFDPEEVAIFGAATVAFMAVFVVLVVFIIRKRKAQKDLERTIAGAKAEHAVEDDDLQIEAEEKATKERKGLMDSSKAKTDDPDMEEGSFVNSPAVRV